MVSLGRVVKVKSGAQTCFWEDVWLGDSALKIQFPTLFHFYSDKDLSVEEAYAGSLDGPVQKISDGI